MVAEAPCQVEPRAGPGGGLTPLEKECPGGHGKGQIDVRTVEQHKCAKCYGTGRYPPPEEM